MRLIGNMIIWAGLYAIYSGTIANIQDPFGFSWEFLILMTIVGAPLLGLGSTIREQTQKTTQSIDDYKAAALARAGLEAAIHKASSKSDLFFLYLRPFSSTNLYRTTSRHLNFFSMELWERDQYDDMERILSLALRPTGSLIGLGRRGEHRGIGRIECDDDDWQDIIKDLCSRATIIFMLPSYREGTLWEVNLLVSEKYISKTIFIIPPEKVGWYEWKDKENQGDWQLTQAACKEIGLHLPDQPDDGALLRYRAGEPCRYPLPSPAPKAWTKTIQKLLAL